MSKPTPYSRTRRSILDITKFLGRIDDLLPHVTDDKIVGHGKILSEPVEWLHEPGLAEACDRLMDLVSAAYDSADEARRAINRGRKP